MHEHGVNPRFQGKRIYTYYEGDGKQKEAEVKGSHGAALADSGIQAW
jgi:hypothetical protein